MSRCYFVFHIVKFVDIYLFLFLDSVETLFILHVSSCFRDQTIFSHILFILKLI